MSAIFKEALDYLEQEISKVKSASKVVEIQDKTYFQKYDLRVTPFQGRIMYLPFSIISKDNNKRTSLEQDTLKEGLKKLGYQPILAGDRGSPGVPHECHWDLSSWGIDKPQPRIYFEDNYTELVDIEPTKVGQILEETVLGKLLQKYWIKTEGISPKDSEKRLLNEIIGKN